MNTDIVANDLTQLSSREQLSALMDGALPPDQTRFLLRRLQHDAPLAECWERWRLSGEVMRGLAPAQRLPSDFALRVGAALRGEDAAASPQAGSRKRTPAWLRWGGGAAMAASLAVVALLARQPNAEAPAASLQMVSASSTPAPAAPSTPDPATQAQTPDGIAEQAVAATAVAVAARPRRESRGKAERTLARMQPALRDEAATPQVAAVEPAVQVPQPDIVTRPWPRSVLPQYASGGLAVGFGEYGTGAVTYNPFEKSVQARASFGDPPATTHADEAAANEPQP